MAVLDTPTGKRTPNGTPRTKTMTMTMPEVNNPLEVGSRVSVQPMSLHHNRKEGLAATIATVSSGNVLLKLSTSASIPAFRKGDVVRIKYWAKADGVIVYCWEAQVLDSLDPQQQSVRVAFEDDGVTVQRRKSYRTGAPVRFSYTVIDAGQPELIGERVTDVVTRNLSVGGLTFETSSLLAVGDILEMTLGLLSAPVTAVGWVVRAKVVTEVGESLNLMALEFLQMEVEEQRQLLEFLARSDLE